MPDYLVQEEDGTSRFDLEDSSDSILLEDSGTMARVSQEPVEAVDLPDTQKARISQEPVEVVDLPDTQKARVSQEPVEVVDLPNTQKARISQLVVEIVVENVAAHTKFSVRFVD